MGVWHRSADAEAAICVTAGRLSRARVAGAALLSLVQIAAIHDCISVPFRLLPPESGWNQLRGASVSGPAESLRVPPEIIGA